MNRAKEGEMIHFGLASWEGIRAVLEGWMSARDATLLSRAFATALTMAKTGASAEYAWEMGAKSIRDDAWAIERYEQRSRSAAETPTHNDVNTDSNIKPNERGDTWECERQ